MSTTHPRYDARVALWEQMLDTYSGEAAVKSKGAVYLPATPGHVLDGMGDGQKGRTAYDAYKGRALYHDFVRQTVQNLVGLMHREPATIELPPEMEAMRESATSKGESLESLLRKINEHQLLFGRLGLLGEAPSGQGPDALPYIAFYNAMSVINWDVGRREQGRQRLELVVLDESEDERVTGMTWETVKKHRLLRLASEVVSPDETGLAAPAAGEYQVAVTREDTEPVDADFKAPSIAGVKLSEIPFVFVNVSDLIPDPGDVPMIGLSNLSLAVYRGEADYRHTLFMQGQETLVVIGSEEDAEAGLRVGSGSRIDLPVGGDAKYVGTVGSGLAEMRQAIEADKEAAAELGARLLPLTGGDPSGESLKTRVAAKTPTLTGIARTGAAALQSMLRILAAWRGLDPETVVVTPNLDFVETEGGPEQLVQLQSAKTMGSPLSQESIHRWMLKNDLTEKTYEDELEAISLEEPLVEPAPEEEPDDDTSEAAGAGDGAD